jgi:hypothetical protein
MNDFEKEKHYFKIVYRKGMFFSIHGVFALDEIVGNLRICLH